MKLLKKLFGKREPIPKLGRNDICWCGSGKKYKHCHLDSDEKKRSKVLQLQPVEEGNRFPGEVSVR